MIGRVPPPRRASLATVRDPLTKEPIDQALVLWFPGPETETGEDVAELQIHGGRAVLEGTLNALARLDGLRPAEAGEFTRRAFENGRIDLTTVEGLADLIGAETEAQRRQAFRQLTGALGRRADTWREKILQALALIEAGIDFADEGDVPPELATKVRSLAVELQRDILETLKGAARAERVRDGLVVAIAGPPNAGK
jgi:tRNA modification GTPase